MKCPECEQIIDDDSAFCKFCGIKSEECPACGGMKKEEKLKIYIGQRRRKIAKQKIWSLIMVFIKILESDFFSYSAFMILLFSGIILDTKYKMSGLLFTTMIVGMLFLAFLPSWLINKWEERVEKDFFEKYPKRRDVVKRNGS